MFNKKNKFSFLTRLSFIIIIQTIFVFAAVVLILFYHQDYNVKESNYIPLKDKFEDLGRRIDRHRSDNPGLGTANYNLEKIHYDIKDIFNDKTLVCSYLYELENSGIVKDRDIYCDDNYFKENELELGHFQAMIDGDLVAYELAHNNDNLIQNIPNNRFVVYYYRFTTTENQPVLITAVIEHNYIIAQRDELASSLGLLFLFSILVALLLVSLINNRFKTPLAALILGFEKTAQGEADFIDETNNDKEINELTQAYNKMTKIRSENKRNLDEYNKQLEDSYTQIKESKEFMNRIIDNSPNSIISTSPDGIVTLFNQKAYEEFGYKNDDVVGRHINEMFTFSVEELQESCDREESIEVLCRRNNDSFFPANMIITQINDGVGEVVSYLYIIRDISESKQFQEMMIRLDRYSTRGKMAGDIAHEINNYLTILSGNIELLPILLKKDNKEKIDKKLSVMKSTVDRISNFTEGLMDNSDAELKFVKTDINQLIETLLTFLHPQNKFDLIKMETRLSTEIPLVDIDPGQIQQLMVNLIYNAADELNTLEGEKVIEIYTVLTTLDDDKTPGVRIRVCDNGGGVPEDKLELLFEKRFTTKRKGHGIGLVTCQRIAAAHSGQMYYRKKDESCFSLLIPVKQQGVHPESEKNQPAPAEIN